MKKEKSPAIIAIILIVMIFIPWSVFYGVVFKRKEPIEFDKTKWDSFSESVSDDGYIRRRMLDDLLETYKIIGMSKEEIRDLLGYNVSRTYGDVAIAYGVSIGMVGPVYFTIYFDENDIAIRYALEEP